MYILNLFSNINDLITFIGNFLTSSFDFVLKGLYFVGSLIGYLPSTIVAIILHLPTVLAIPLVSFFSFLIGMLALKIIALVLSAADIL